MLHKGSGSVAFAAGVGAMIGVAIANQFVSSIFSWVIGAVVCGIVAWIAQAPMEFFRGVSRAYVDMKGWRPDARFWINAKCFGSSLLLGCVLAIYSAGAMMFLLGGPISQHIRVTNAFFVLTSMIGTLMVFSFVVGQVDSDLEGRQLRTKYVIYTVVIFLPFVFPFAVLYGTWKALAWITPRVPALLRWSWAFLKHAFLYVHSAERRIAVTGGIVGYAGAILLHQQPLFGGVLGALLALVEYELIAIRWLKLRPERIFSR